MRVLFLGDIVGHPGRDAAAAVIPVLRREFAPVDFVIANGENAASGFGLTAKVMGELFALGIDCLTGGNHIWDKKEFLSVLDAEPCILRPANYPAGCPGHGMYILRKDGKSLAVLNLQGRVFLQTIDCPFRVADDMLAQVGERAIFVDFHAEATSEKWALFRFLDGRVSAVVGTHTHVQTADEQVLPGGTAVISDAGMTGGHGGVIGMETEGVLSRFRSGMPSKFEVARSDLRVQGVVLDVDDETGRAEQIRRINCRCV